MSGDESIVHRNESKGEKLKGHPQEPGGGDGLPQPFVQLFANLRRGLALERAARDKEEGDVGGSEEALVEGEVCPQPRVPRTVGHGQSVVQEPVPVDDHGGVQDAAEQDHVARATPVVGLPGRVLHQVLRQSVPYGDEHGTGADLRQDRSSREGLSVEPEGTKVAETQPEHFFDTRKRREPWRA